MRLPWVHRLPLLEPALELRSARTGRGVQSAAVSACKEMVRHARDHGAVVTAELQRRENAVQIRTLRKQRPQP